jgi:replicative DNA helicase
MNQILVNQRPLSSSPQKPGDSSDLNSYIFTYHEAAELARDDLAFRRENPEAGVPFTALGFGDQVAPAGPGELVLTLGRPGHMKTGTICILANEREKYLRDIGEDRHILIVTAETTIERLMYNFIAAEEGISKTDLAWGRLNEEQWRIVDRYPLVKGARNLWFYGNSSRLAAKRYMPPAEMKPQTIANAIDAVANWRKSKLNVLDMVAIDYFQILEPNRYDREARVRYENVMRDIKRISLTLPGPLFVACQAKQEVDKRDDPLPLQNDIEQTNEAHKSADIIISQMVPSLYPEKFKPGTSCHDITITAEYLDKLLLYSLRKHKMSGILNNEHWVFADFATNRILNANPFVPKALNEI